MSDGSISIDMTIPGVRESVALLVCTSRLTLECLGLGSRFSTLNAAKRNGFTTAGTKHGALLDCIGLARVLDPNHEPSEQTVRALRERLGDKADAKIKTALRRGDQFRAILDALPEGEQPANVFWRGVSRSYK